MQVCETLRSASSERDVLFGTVRTTSKVAFVLPNRSQTEDPSVDRVTTNFKQLEQELIVSKQLSRFGVSFFDGTKIAPFIISGGSHGLALESPDAEGFKWANSDAYVWRIAGIDQATYDSIKDDVATICALTVDYRGPGDTGVLSASGNWALYTREVEFWIYNTKSGEILAKFNIDETLDEKPHTYRSGTSFSGSAARRVDKRSL